MTYRTCILAAMGIALSIGSMNVQAGVEEPQRGTSTEPTLYVVGYAHLDTQWRWAYTDTIGQYIPKTLYDNFSLMDTYPSYIFNFSGSRRYRMMEEYYPAGFAQLEGYVASGQWFPAGSSVDEGDSVVPSAESMIRHTLLGNLYFEQKFGVTSEEFMLPDCFGFPASLPSILAHCGIKGFSTQKLTWGSAVGIPFNVGVWEGLDGQAVVAALNPGAYVSTIDSDLSEDSGWLNRVNQNGATSGVYADFRYYGTGDTGGSPTSGSVQWVDTSVHGTGPLTVRSVAADEMFNEVPPPSMSAWPRYQGDLLLTQHSAGSITSQAYMKRLNYRNEILAPAAEQAAYFADWMGGPAYPQTRLTDAWYLVLGSQMHDILPGTSIPFAYELAWNDDIIAWNQFAGVVDGSVSMMAEAMDTQATGTPVVVYNPLAVDREDVVEATISMGTPLPAAVRVFDPDGVEVPSQITGSDDTAGTLDILFVADIPSSGLAVFDVQPAATPATSSLVVTTSSLENDRYVVMLNANGDISSIYDKANARELLSSPARLAFKHDYPSIYPAWNMDWSDAQQAPIGYVDGTPAIQIVEDGAARVAVEVLRESEGSSFSQTIRLSAGDGGNRIEFDNDINWRSQVVNVKAEFPLTISNPDATYNWEVGKIDRGNNNSAKYEVPSHQWFGLTDENGDFGVSVLTDCKYGSDKPNDSVLRLTLIRTPGASWYPDQGTQDWGQHEILYGLTSHPGDWATGQVDWQALRLSSPPIAFQTTAHAGSLGSRFSMISVNDLGVRLMAVKKAERTNELVVRLVELYGEDATGVRVSLPVDITAAREVDGQERTIGTATIDNGELLTDLTPYTLRTFALTLDTTPTTLPAVVQASITLPYNADVVSENGESVTDGFDAGANCLPAEMLPAQIDYHGVQFGLTGLSPGEDNAVKCAGQTISLPTGNWNRVYLLAAAADGDHDVTFQIDGNDVPMRIQDWGGYIGQWYNRVWAGSAVTSIDDAYIKRDPVAWFASHHQRSNGEDQIYSYSYLFAYPIDLPQGASDLTLPIDDRIVIMAATVAEDPTAGTQLAHSLMDEFPELVVVEPDPSPPMFPIAASGWNADIVIEQAASDPLTDYADPFDVLNGWTFYEAGFPGGDGSDGMPSSLTFNSTVEPDTAVQLQPYDGPNVLLLESGATTSGTLTFAPEDQIAYGRLGIFASSSNATAASQGAFVINFTDGSSSDPIPYNAYDWFYNVSDNALTNMGRMAFDGMFDNRYDEPRIYQTTLDLSEMGLSTKAIESLTLSLANNANTTAVFAVSGAESTDLTETTSIPLAYNWNGMVHTSAEQNNPDNPDGFRSISDRALFLNDGTTPSLDLAQLPYTFVEESGALDMVALVNRNLVDLGHWAFDSSANGDDIGTQPNWLTDLDQSSVTTTVNPPIVMDAGARAGVVFNHSNGGGSFDMTLNFVSGLSVTVTLSAPDWYESQTAPAPGAGLSRQATLGTFPGAGGHDSGTPSGDLNLVEAIATRDEILENIGIDIEGQALSSLTFDNRSTPQSVGIYAMTVETTVDANSCSLTALPACMAGPGGGIGQGCACHDLDEDGDITLADYVMLQQAAGQ